MVGRRGHWRRGQSWEERDVMGEGTMRGGGDSDGKVWVGRRGSDGKVWVGRRGSDGKEGAVMGRRGQ